MVKPKRLASLSRISTEGSTIPEQVWVADITYIELNEGFCYLHLITDAYSKKIIGYKLSDNLCASSSMEALNIAITNRKYKKYKLIHHSDRGIQYCSQGYCSILKKNNIEISMTENGDPYENAIAERVNGILKGEFGLGEKFEEQYQVALQLSQSIKLYNQKRPHLSNHYLTPELMHKQSQLKRKTWKKNTSKIITLEVCN